MSVGFIALLLVKKHNLTLRHFYNAYNVGPENSGSKHDR